MMDDDRIKADEEIHEFGTRYLKETDDVFTHNAWDSVEWSNEQQELAKSAVASNSVKLLQTEIIAAYEENASLCWDKFYSVHDNKFFKDRQWLFREFPELLGSLNSLCAGLDNQNDPHTTNGNLKRSNVSVLEVGCGCGNTIFPILETNNDPNLLLYACDFSSSAISLVKSHELYKDGRCHAFVCDVSAESVDMPFAPESLDYIVMIFVLSAICPSKIPLVIHRLSQYLKPNGMLLFRDYGLYDMTQLRFKPGRCLADNFYVRGDGTRVYYFTQDELHNLFTKAGLEKEQNFLDRRLQEHVFESLSIIVWVSSGQENYLISRRHFDRVLQTQTLSSNASEEQRCKNRNRNTRRVCKLEMHSYFVCKLLYYLDVPSLCEVFCRKCCFLFDLSTTRQCYIRTFNPPKFPLDYTWNYRIHVLIQRSLELEKLMWWLSTIGGAFSCLGDQLTQFALKAHEVSWSQLKIAVALGDPVLASRCRLYIGISMIQMGQYMVARRIVRKEFRYALSIDSDLLKNICKGIWSKLSFEYVSHRKKRLVKPIKSVALSTNVR